MQLLMRPLGVEPRFQEPESYVRSITLRAQFVLYFNKIIGINQEKLTDIF